MSSMLDKLKKLNKYAENASPEEIQELYIKAMERAEMDKKLLETHVEIDKVILERYRIEVEALRKQVETLNMELAKEEEVVDELALLHDHMRTCNYYVWKEDEELREKCQCYDHKHYNSMNLANAARQRQKERKLT